MHMMSVVLMSLVMPMVCSPLCDMLPGVVGHLLLPQSGARPHGLQDAGRLARRGGGSLSVLQSIVVQSNTLIHQVRNSQ